MNDEDIETLVACCRSFINREGIKSPFEALAVFEGQLKRHLASKIANADYTAPIRLVRTKSGHLRQVK